MHTAKSCLRDDFFDSFPRPVLQSRLSYYPASKLSSRNMALQPRQFPSTGFERIGPGDTIEEETLPDYIRDEYYPVRIGDVFENRYQVVSKLGYGTTSTVWLARDLRTQGFWALKVHINTIKHNHELDVHQYLKDFDVEHSGRDNVRRLEDSFKLKNPTKDDSMHHVFVMTPLGMSLRSLQRMQRTSVFPQTMVRNAVDQILFALSYLHQVKVVHTDLHADNLLIAIINPSVLSAAEDREMHQPTARKRVSDIGFIHVSQPIFGGAGPLILCDLGQARTGGDEHVGIAMPAVYRAPEVILNMKWNTAVDVWSLGLMIWDFFHLEGLFQIYDDTSPELNDAHHLAAMTALLGPPPLEFMLKSPEQTTKYWDTQGQWKGPVPLPPKKDIKVLLSDALEGEDRVKFLHFLECVLCWLPSDRFTADEAYFHPWLRGGELPTEAVSNDGSKP
ncbi:kinase-like protein [Trichoderma austrokoningii]